MVSIHNDIWNLSLSGIFIAFIFNKQNIIGTTVCLVLLAVLTPSLLYDEV